MGEARALDPVANDRPPQNRAAQTDQAVAPTPTDQAQPSAQP